MILERPIMERVGGGQTNAPERAWPHPYALASPYPSVTITTCYPPCSAHPYALARVPTVAISAFQLPNGPLSNPGLSNPCALGA